MSGEGRDRDVLQIGPLARLGEGSGREERLRRTIAAGRFHSPGPLPKG